jgi:hypothetical protein
MALARDATIKIFGSAQWCKIQQSIELVLVDVSKWPQCEIQKSKQLTLAQWHKIQQSK